MRMSRVNISHIQLYAFTGGTEGGDHQIKKQNKKGKNTKQTNKKDENSEAARTFNISVCTSERVAAGLCALYGESIVSYRSGP